MLHTYIVIHTIIYNCIHKNDNYIYAYTFLYITYCTHICIVIYTIIYICIHIYIPNTINKFHSIYIHIHIRKLIPTITYYMYTNLHTYKQVTYIYIHIHAHTHTHINILDIAYHI